MTTGRDEEAAGVGDSVVECQYVRPLGYYAALLEGRSAGAVHGALKKGSYQEATRKLPGSYQVPGAPALKKGIDEVVLVSGSQCGLPVA